MGKKENKEANPIVKALINYKYQDEQINKQVIIYKRTKKERIKNKKFGQIFSGAIKERGIIKCDELVLLDMEIYGKMQTDIDKMERRLFELKKEQGTKNNKQAK